MLLLASMGARAALCPDEPLEVALDATQQIQDAYEDVDPVALRDAVAQLDVAIGCLKQPAKPSVVVEIHNAKALQHWYDGDEQGTVRAWAAARALEPTLQLTSTWPEAHPIRAIWNEASRQSSERLTLQRRPPGGWIVDGSETSDVPISRAFVVQARSADGEILYSDYCQHLAEVHMTDWAELDPTARQLRRRRARLVGSAMAGGFAAGAVISLSASSDARRAFRAAPYERSLASRANAWATAATVLGGSAVASGVLTWTIQW